MLVQMSDAFPARIEVTFSMTADDYARYFAVVQREETSRGSLIPFVVALLCSIVVALTFREIAAYLVPDSEVIDMVGHFSLIAFLLGASFLVAALFVGRRIALRKYVSGTLNAYESKTAVFDAAGVGLNGQLSQATWRWAAVNRFSNEDGLFLIWIGRSAAVVIPCRSFGDEGASATAFVRARLSEAG
jgi:hypothetical protein